MMSDCPATECNFHELLCLQSDASTAADRSSIRQTPGLQDIYKYNSCGGFLSCLLSESLDSEMALEAQFGTCTDLPAFGSGSSCGSTIGLQAFKSKYLCDNHEGMCEQETDCCNLGVKVSHPQPIFSVASSSPTVTSAYINHSKKDTNEEISRAENFRNVAEIPDVDSTSAETNQEKETEKHHRSKKIKIDQPRYAFKTRSDADILDDGFKWRKYGQKAVKNNPHPRSYYRCTHNKCSVKKRVERFLEDPGIVITTYHGIHNHPSHSTCEIVTYPSPVLQLLPIRQSIFGTPENLLQIQS